MFSVKRIQEYLNITCEEAKEVRAILDLQLVRGERTEREKDSPEYEIWHDSPSRKLYMVNRLKIGYCGVEIIRSSEDTYSTFSGITYLNAGDTYTGTLMFDHKRGKWLLSSWGDVVERYPRRFAE